MAFLLPSFISMQVSQMNEKMYDFEQNKRNNLIFYGVTFVKLTTVCRFCFYSDWTPKGFLVCNNHHNIFPQLAVEAGETGESLAVAVQRLLR